MAGTAVRPDNTCGNAEVVFQPTSGSSGDGSASR
jgi:hypothetical protein